MKHLLPHGIMRGYGQYLSQRFPETFSFDSIQIELASHPKDVDILLEAFSVRFDPARKQPHPSVSLRVPDHFQGEILPLLWKAIHDTVRVNAYCMGYAIDQALALKILHLDGMIEIFMDHPTFQGVLLKKNMMARGGVRWSGRSDFRRECLQLMQTQVLKNAIIVPSGAKGAFFLKDASSSEALTAYRLYVEALLDLSDNWTEGRILHPDQIRCYDGPDFYNVVAADKGTAFFSDEANAIALKKKYWLGDAFASGGSLGYNHKDLAITARGVWVSVRHHLQELGIPEGPATPLTVVGVGDMAGDVFGNGLLGSQNLKLLAAFNHDFIFIDPNPDPVISYEERLRLFHLPKSTWADYGKLSSGGLIASRHQGPVILSEKVQQLLETTKFSMEPHELIQRILRLSVDLLWLGGVGTFVQGEGEQDVGDDANRSLRVLGAQVRAKVIGEGANLGCTTQGRIEYALSGGTLNTDAIDNAAGVNCSDHEVNCKIVLDSLIQQGKLSMQERISILQESTEEICTRVLRENKWQNVAISMACREGSMQNSIPLALKFLAKVEAHSTFDPIHLGAIAETLQYSHGVSKKAITRPEMSVLLAYSKIYCKENIGDSDWGKEESIAYFPDPIAHRFGEEISSHWLFPFLKKTVLSNRLVDLLGPLTLYAGSSMDFVSRLQWAFAFDHVFEGVRLARIVETLWDQDLSKVYAMLGLFQSLFLASLTYESSEISDTPLRIAEKLAGNREGLDISAEFMALRQQYVEALAIGEGESASWRL